MLGFVVCTGGLESKGKDVMLETTRLKNLYIIESGVGLLSSFVVVGGSAVCKFRHHIFPLWCVIFVSP